MKKLILVAGAVALAAPSMASAAAYFTVTGGTASGIATNNSFKTQLASAPYNMGSYVTTGSSLNLTSSAEIKWYYLGSESGYFSTFHAPGGVTGAETVNGLQNKFGAPVYLGTSTVMATGAISGLSFTSSSGLTANMGDRGFGIFTPGGYTGGNLTQIILGYDDERSNPDGNHDDIMILGVIGREVPEPATWAMMLLGFGVVGYSMRRRAQAGLGMVRA